MSQRYEHYRSQPFEDIARADRLLNPDKHAPDSVPSTDDVRLAHGLCALAQAKMTGGGRAH